MKLENEARFEQDVEELIKEIHTQYGYDFNGYARASVYRRIKRFLSHKHLTSMEALRKELFLDSYFFENFLQEITVNVTEMFRDPSFFLSLRENVLPILSTYPFIKIWDAGCSTGEELFSLAILLKEEGLLERTKIYATDINQKVLKQAKAGIFSAANMPAYTSGYYAAGGRQEFSSYYSSNYGSVKFDSSLVKNVIIYPHNLATDFSFNEFHLILCRNVLIYFNRELQERVFKLFDESMVSLGYLALGKKETLAMSEISSNYNFVDKNNRIYRKIN
ncbi:protein-glutamate O-methyltransferase CheR [Pontibacter sp. BT310]|uniref:Protein-glutamate O-methyltransferase CheR n=1 Tax=Pontibacter populi TaxID=890055 RepID=A0ABS6X6C5_9BACT|nr:MULTISPECIES: protein-glutamate O-methyltransferase CheR [Pontibacter]MBJ6116699.1 protein-glutamate O-methyltransferase CheR [Pontibacter sp. BT310]MBR0569123.1 protein-glutamate O-methyltransferase CheR [Microvirga sp. STS03]MBW3363553.1 protein-glutamate O-methyltransferase CheR [Pontibacter populi]